MNKKITAIIPIYNGEKYISECVDSILEQTYKKFEIIIINDGSEDNTQNIIENYAKKYKNIKTYTIKNSGQGYARNYALTKATGDYIMFIDVDDYIESVTFEVALKRLEEDKSDFAYLDYKYYFENTGKYTYSGKGKFFSEKYLENDDCTRLIGINSYYTVNKVYKKDFLIKNTIKYAEKHIYEDFVFWVKCVLNAKKISIIHSPLYVIRVNENSTTKTNHDTDKHMVGFLKAYDECIKELNSSNEKTKRQFIKYMLKKFILYYNKRTPKRYQKEFLNGFYNRLKKEDIEKIYRKSYLNNCFYKIGLLKSKLCFKLYIKMGNIQKETKKIKGKVRKIKRKTTRKQISENLKAFRIYNGNINDQILFVGFNYRYTGNSRYLYEEMKKTNIKNVYFATEDTLVKEKDRILPNSKEFYEKLYTSKIVIFETWIPRCFLKPEGVVWIELWHGTPLKKMLYDSNEKEITANKPKNKSEKFYMIEKMDYLLTDNKNINHYFETSFLINKNKLLDFGYPRVEYLIKNKNNEKLKESIRKSLNIKPHQKIVTYLPTWRDYNYKELSEEQYDFDYFLDLEKLKKNLPKDYEIICKDHAYLKRNNNLNDVEIETQELLLVSDFVITDYSSVMFDAFALDIPVGIISKDYEKYDISRGLYEDMWQDLKPFITTNEKDLGNLIKKYKKDVAYKTIKNKYCYKKGGDLIEFITKIKKI